jgi:myo-inositol-1(or 4)-monophosphatase
MNPRDFAIDMAKQAGHLMLTNFMLGMAREWKADNTPLTVTDTAINRLVIEAVQKYFPEHGILGEEESYESEREYLWVCDPIDGTIPFTHGIPLSTFCLALVHNGEAQLGVIYDPYMDRLFMAEKGRGAFLNEEPIHVSDQATLAQSALSIDSFFRFPELDLLRRQLLNEKAKIYNLYSAAYGYGLVAAGELIGGFFSNISTWDVAAAALIVQEAGGRVTDMFGQPLLFNTTEKFSCLATNGKVHDQILEMIAQVKNQP